MYVSQLSSRAQIIIKSRVLSNLLENGTSFPEVNNHINELPNNKIYDLDEHFNNQEIKKLLLI